MDEKKYRVDKQDYAEGVYKDGPVKNVLPSGEKEPYEYAGPRIEEMLVNQHKVEYLRNFEDELYDDAIRSGDVQFHSEP